MSTNHYKLHPNNMYGIAFTDNSSTIISALQHALARNSGELPIDIGYSFFKNNLVTNTSAILANTGQFNTVSAILRKLYKR
jgi:hypothetical protein